MKKDKDTSFLRQFIKDLGDENITVASDGLSSGNFHDYIDTGSFALNALISHSLFGGFPDNKVIGLAGVESAGKTFLVDGVMGAFLTKFEDSLCFIYDSESTKIKTDMEKRGFDTDRIAIAEVVTVERFKHSVLQMLEKYEKKKEKPRIMVVLDSLGQLSTEKEMADSLSGKDKKDMTRQGAIRSCFRTLQIASAKLKVPIFVTNHVYSIIGEYVARNEMSGGGGLKYAASQIIYLTKKKDKEEDEGIKKVTGAIVTANLVKSRLSKEYKSVSIRIKYSGGLDRYYGLLPLAEEAGIFKKISTKYQLPNTEETVFGKEILANPEKFFTKEVLDSIEVYVQKEFDYGAEEDEDPDFDGLIQEEAASEEVITED